MAPSKRAADSPPDTLPPNKKGKQRYDEDVIVISSDDDLEESQVSGDQSIPPGKRMLWSTIRLNPPVRGLDEAYPIQEILHVVTFEDNAYPAHMDITPELLPPADTTHDPHFDLGMNLRSDWMRVKYNAAASTSQTNATNLPLQRLEEPARQALKRLHKTSGAKPRRKYTGPGARYRESLEQARLENPNFMDDLKTLAAAFSQPYPT